MDVVRIEALPRETGKSATRAIRREGNVPCIIYGHKMKPVAFQMPEKQMTQLAFSREARRIRIKVDKKSFNCVLKDVEVHPLTGKPIHADFIELRRGEKVTVAVPVRYHGTPIGQTEEGGETQVVVHELEVRCLPEDIPAYIDVDVKDLRIGDALHISDLSVENVEFISSPEKAIVTVLAPKVAAVEVEEEEELEAGEIEAEADELTEPEE